MSDGTPPRHRPFRIALCNEVLGDLPFDQQCALATDLGYDGLEVAPFTLAGDPRTLRERDATRLRRTAEDVGIHITGLHWLLRAPQGLSITDPDPRVRSTTLEVIEALIDLCAALGGSVLVHGSPAQRTLSADDPAGDAARGRATFAFAAEHAERAGVRYLIEPLAREETSFVNTVGEAATIVREIGSPALATMLDTRAARLTETEPIEPLLERGLQDGTIAHVHVNDRDLRAPGQGADRFAGVVDVLLRCAYTGTVSIEPFRYEPDGPTVAARAIGYLDGLVEAAASHPGSDNR